MPQPSHHTTGAAASGPQTDFTINATGALNLLEAASRHTPDATFIDMSNNKVYGTCQITCRSSSSTLDTSLRAIIATTVGSIPRYPSIARCTRCSVSPRRPATSGAGVRSVFRDADRLPSRRLPHGSGPGGGEAPRVPVLPGQVQRLAMAAHASIVASAARTSRTATAKARGSPRYRVRYQAREPQSRNGQGKALGENRRIAQYRAGDMDSKKRKVSTKQLAANQRNAALSTGPKSEEGKEVVKRNALKHGLLAKEALLPGEDADSFEELSERLYADLRPEGAIETALVERIVGGLWRLRRLQRVEAGIFENEICAAAREREDQGTRPDELTMRDLVNPRAAPSAEERAQAVENAGTAGWGTAFLRDAYQGNAFSKLSRYEATIERSVLSSLHELQRLQSARVEGVGAVPVAADLNVSISRE
jgi:hypothetical protein